MSSVVESNPSLRGRSAIIESTYHAAPAAFLPSNTNASSASSSSGPSSVLVARRAIGMQKQRSTSHLPTGTGEQAWQAELAHRPPARTMGAGSHHPPPRRVPVPLADTAPPSMAEYTMASQRSSTASPSSLPSSPSPSPSGGKVTVLDAFDRPKRTLTASKSFTMTTVGNLAASMAMESIGPTATTAAATTSTSSTSRPGPTPIQDPQASRSQTTHLKHALPSSSSFAAEAQRNQSVSYTLGGDDGGSHQYRNVSSPARLGGTMMGGARRATEAAPALGRWAGAEAGAGAMEPPLPPMPAFSAHHGMNGLTSPASTSGNAGTLGGAGTGTGVPKSPAQSRIAKLRAAWSPRAKVGPLPSATPDHTTSPSGGTGGGGVGSAGTPGGASSTTGPPSASSSTAPSSQKEKEKEKEKDKEKEPTTRSSRAFSIVPSRSSGGHGKDGKDSAKNQRVSLGNIGSPTLMSFTSLNEHGQLLNLNAAAAAAAAGGGANGGIMALNRAMPLTSLREAAAVAAAARAAQAPPREGGAGAGPSSVGPDRPSLASPVQNVDLDTSGGDEGGIKTLPNRGGSWGVRSSLGMLRAQGAHASFDSLPLTVSAKGDGVGPSGLAHAYAPAPAPTHGTPSTTTCPIPPAPNHARPGLPLTPQIPKRSPKSLARGARQRSATQGAYSSPFKDGSLTMTAAAGSASAAASAGVPLPSPTALSRTSEESSAAGGSRLSTGTDAASADGGRVVSTISSSSSGSRPTWSNLEPVRERRRAERSATISHSGSANTIMASLRAGGSPLSDTLAALRNPDSSRHADEGLPTMWTQGTDITGYTAASESGDPVPDALGLVLSASPTSETHLSAEQGPSASASATSRASRPHDGSPESGHTPSTAATASLPGSPASPISILKGSYAFGSTAPRSPVQRRRPVPFPASEPVPQAQSRLEAAAGVGQGKVLLTASPSLAAALPAVESDMTETPLPDAAAFASELVRVEREGGWDEARAGRPDVRRAPSPFGTNSLGLSGSAARSSSISVGDGTPADRHHPQSQHLLATGAALAPMSRFSLDTEPDADTQAYAIDRSAAPSRASSTAFTSAGSRFAKKYTFKKISSPQQYRLMLEEEEQGWKARAHEAEGHLARLAAGFGGRGVVGAAAPSPAQTLDKSLYLSETLSAHTASSRSGAGEGGGSSGADHLCPSLYEVSSVEGSADGHSARRDDLDDADRASGRVRTRTDTATSTLSSPRMRQSSSGYEGLIERGGLFGLYEHERDDSSWKEGMATGAAAATTPGQHALQAPVVLEPSPEKKRSTKRDTVESLLLRAADLLADRSGTATQPLRLRRSSSRQVETAKNGSEAGQELDVDVELIPEGLELAGPMDPSTGLVPYQLRWKVIVRNKHDDTKNVKTVHGAAKVVTGTSEILSPVAFCSPLSSIIKTPESRSTSFPSSLSAAATSPPAHTVAPAATTSIGTRTTGSSVVLFSSEDGGSVASHVAFPYAMHAFSNPFRPGHSMRGSIASGLEQIGLGERPGAAGAVQLQHLRAASFSYAPPSQRGSASASAAGAPSSRAASGSASTTHNKLKEGSVEDEKSLTALNSPKSPAFMPKPLLLLQNSAVAGTGATATSTTAAAVSASGANSPSSLYSSETRNTSIVSLGPLVARRRFDSGASLSPASRALAEFPSFSSSSSPVLEATARLGSASTSASVSSATSSSAASGSAGGGGSSGGRRRQLSYISSTSRASLDRGAAAAWVRPRVISTGMSTAGTTGTSAATMALLARSSPYLSSSSSAAVGASPHYHHYQTTTSTSVTASPATYTSSPSAATPSGAAMEQSAGSTPRSYAYVQGQGQGRAEAVVKDPAATAKAEGAALPACLSSSSVSTASGRLAAITGFAEA